MRNAFSIVCSDKTNIHLTKNMDAVNYIPYVLNETYDAQVLLNGCSKQC
jgi:hypothetical protein